MATTSPDAAIPLITIVIPIYNEEGIVREAVTRLRSELAMLPWSYEIILAENGSTDGTVRLAAHLAGEAPEVFLVSSDQPNYGRALRAGLERARGTYCICDEIDLCDVDFYRRALDLLEHHDADLVIGSKTMKGAHDRRPMMRRVATRVINGLLRATTHFRGSDTHGLKAFRREALAPIVEACTLERDLFASEFVIRADRANLDLVEIPVSVAEKRRTPISLATRVPSVLTDLARLRAALDKS